MIKATIMDKAGQIVHERSFDEMQDATIWSDEVMAHDKDAAHVTITRQQREEWHHRLIASTQGGRVVETARVDDPEKIEAEHERLLALPDVKIVTTFGPFLTRRI